MTSPYKSPSVLQLLEDGLTFLAKWFADIVYAVFIAPFEKKEWNTPGTSIRPQRPEEAAEQAETDTRITVRVYRPRRSVGKNDKE